PVVAGTHQVLADVDVEAVELRAGVHGDGAVELARQADQLGVAARHGQRHAVGGVEDVDERPGQHRRAEAVERDVLDAGGQEEVAALQAAGLALVEPEAGPDAQARAPVVVHVVVAEEDRGAAEAEHAGDRHAVEVGGRAGGAAGDQGRHVHAAGAPEQVLGGGPDAAGRAARAVGAARAG